MDVLVHKEFMNREDISLVFPLLEIVIATHPLPPIALLSTHRNIPKDIHCEYIQRYIFMVYVADFFLNLS